MEHFPDSIYSVMKKEMEPRRERELVDIFRRYYDEALSNSPLLAHTPEQLYRLAEMATFQDLWQRPIQFLPILRWTAYTPGPRQHPSPPRIIHPALVKQVHYDNFPSFPSSSAQGNVSANFQGPAFAQGQQQPAQHFPPIAAYQSQGFGRIQSQVQPMMYQAQGSGPEIQSFVQNMQAPSFISTNATDAVAHTQVFGQTTQSPLFGVTTSSQESKIAVAAKKRSRGLHLKIKEEKRVAAIGSNHRRKTEAEAAKHAKAISRKSSSSLRSGPRNHRPGKGSHTAYKGLSKSHITGRSFCQQGPASTNAHRLRSQYTPQGSSIHTANTTIQAIRAISNVAETKNYIDEGRHETKSSAYGRGTPKGSKIPNYNGGGLKETKSSAHFEGAQPGAQSATSTRKVYLKSTPAKMALALTESGRLFRTAFRGNSVQDCFFC